MLWLTWQMWILLLLAFAGGVIAGWIARGQSDAPDTAPAASEPEPAPAAPPSPKPASAQKSAAGDASPAAPSPRSATAGAAKPAEPKDSEPKVSEPASGGDDLTRIKGLGPKAAEKLRGLGVTRFDQIAAWSEADMKRIDEAIDGKGRITREDWVGQAKAMSGA